jgi:hypothetical protein
MKWMLPCVLAMIVGVAGFGVWGIDLIAGLFCTLMMIAMVPMMAAPAVAKIRQHGHERR